MLEVVLVPLVVFGAVAGLLAWRVALDRRHEKALALRAEIHAALNRALHGESMVAVDVEPASLAHTGRVVLVTPTGYEWLVHEAWQPIVERVPPDYELVLRHAA